MLLAAVCSASAQENTGTGDATMIYAYINDSVLTIKPSGNSSSEAFMTLLAAGDLSVEMHDYGSFEKVGPLGTTLPRNDEPITTEPGDVILYQGNQITIYYAVNSWDFTRLGKVQGLTQDELKQILGTGGITARFSLTPPENSISKNRPSGSTADTRCPLSAWAPGHFPMNRRKIPSIMPSKPECG